MRHKLKLLNLVLAMVFIFSFTACTITACTTPKTAPTDGKFGFLRNVFDMDQEKIEETGAAWLDLLSL